MVIAQITGGLGNQLFQYAAAKALSIHHQVPLLLEVSSFYRTELPDKKKEHFASGSLRFIFLPFFASFFVPVFVEWL